MTKFDVHFLLKGPAGAVEAPNSTNPVEADCLATLLRDLAKGLPGNKAFGLECVGVRVEPAKGEALEGKTEPCCECGEDYPRADLVGGGHIYCPKCRVAGAARKGAAPAP